MSIESAVAAGRMAAESRMTSTATVRRESGHGAQDETSGLEGGTWTAVVTDSPFRLGGAERGGSSSRSFTVGGVEMTLAVRLAHFPAGTDLDDGDLIDVTSGENAGTVWRVVEGDWADQQTALRVPVIATDRPGEWG